MRERMIAGGVIGAIIGIAVGYAIFAFGNSTFSFAEWLAGELSLHAKDPFIWALLGSVCGASLTLILTRKNSN